MSQNLKTPKTPSRRSRSVTKTPLTPSLLAGLNTLNIVSPTKSRGKSNGMLTTSKSAAYLPDLPQPKSRQTSPLKRSTSNGMLLSEELQRQANSGAMRRNGPESRMNVITNDYVPPPQMETKRSKSQPVIAHRERLFPREQTAIILDPRDRFITNRDEQDLAHTLELMNLNPRSASPGHTARLAEAAELPVNKRILAFHEAPPLPSSDPLLAKHREIVKPLLSRPPPLASSTGTYTNKTRRIPTQPERVLDAPGMVDDFYLNLISWSCLNVVAVALGESTYIWKAESGSVIHVGDAQEGSYVASVDFSNDGAFLAVGMGTGDVELWDVETNSKLRTMAGHQAQVAAMSWNGHILSSACGDGSIWHHDVRIARHKVMELLGHTGEVCGLKWRQDGEMLASGGNDNVVNVWDGRVGDVGEETRGTAKWTKRNHTAAVKAVGWCPWQPSLLATGGGTNDAKIHIWNTTTGARIHTISTPSQVTSLHFAPHKKEILSTHGYPTNSVMIHAYPSLERIAEIRDAHESRVLFSCVSPAGDMVCTGAGDENLKFWKVWELPRVTGGKKKEGLSSSTSSGILAIR